MTKAQRILLGLTVNICRMVRTLHEHKKIKKKKNVKVFECTVLLATVAISLLLPRAQAANYRLTSISSEASDKNVTHCISHAH